MQRAAGSLRSSHRRFALAGVVLCLALTSAAHSANGAFYGKQFSGSGTVVVTGRKK